jgi:SAM-dependent methyltransferase
VKPKPPHLGPAYGAQFGDPAIVAAYDRRPPYADEAIDIILGLLPDGARHVLDVGCGRGELAIPLAARGASVDAVDPSQAMLDSGKARPGADDPGLRWIHGPIETAPLCPPYDLATAGQSLHWTEWSVSLPRIASVLVPEARLVMVDRTFDASPWSDELQRLTQRYSTNRETAPFVLVDELTARGLFEEQGRTETPRRPHSQSLADYVESFHSANGFSRDRMTAASAAEFDAAVTALVRAHVGDAPVVVGTGVRIVWGRPMGGS